MVNVSHKPATNRSATASGKIHLNREAIQLVEEDSRSSKGSVLGVAQLAGILAAKRTWELIPLCHPLPLSHVEVEWGVSGEECSVEVVVRVRCEGKTGVEMEALCGVMGALLTVFDMTKSVSHDYVITDVKVKEKAGGKTGHTHFHQTD